MWKEFWYESRESCAHCVVVLKRLRGADAAQNTANQPHKVIYFSFSVKITGTVLLLHDATQYDFMYERIKYAKLNWICIIYIKLPCASINIIYFIYCLEFFNRSTNNIAGFFKTHMVWERNRMQKGDVTILLLDWVCTLRQARNIWTI